MKKPTSLLMLAALASVSAITSPSGTNGLNHVKKFDDDGSRPLGIAHDINTGMGGGTGSKMLADAKSTNQDIKYFGNDNSTKGLGAGDVNPISLPSEITAGGGTTIGGAGDLATT